ncbi:MAG: hypothetical protein AAGA31_08620 [Bacteroidota bacterium]
MRLHDLNKLGRLGPTIDRSTPNKPRVYYRYTSNCHIQAGDVLYRTTNIKGAYAFYHVHTATNRPLKDDETPEEWFHEFYCEVERIRIYSRDELKELRLMVYELLGIKSPEERVHFIS